MQTVYLKGELGERFGEKWTMNVNRVSDVFKLIECQREGYRPYMQECIENGVDFAVQRGENYIDESELMLSVGTEDITITPIPAGSKSKVAKLITAALMIYTGYYVLDAAGGLAAMNSAMGGGPTTVALSTKVAGWTMITLGTSLGLRTLGEMMMPDGSMDQEDDSHLFSGPQNTMIQGGAVPVLYGEMIVGGANINTSYTAHMDPAYGSGVAVNVPLGSNEGSGEVDSQVED